MRRGKPKRFPVLSRNELLCQLNIGFGRTLNVATATCHQDISQLKQHVSIIHCDRGDSWLYPLEKELESPSPSVLIGISKFLTEQLPKTS